MRPAEQNSAAARGGLTPHRYPAVLVAFTVLILGAVAYSATLIPSYVQALVALHRAKMAIAAGDRAASEAGLLDVLRVFPSSEAARIEMAVLLLADPTEARQRRGLAYLDGLALDKYAWERITSVLPAKSRSASSPAQK